MNLLEHEAKSLLSISGIAVPKGVLVRNDSTPPFLPLVLKSQVPVGGRGKAGAIKIASSESEYIQAVSDIMSLPVKGHTPDLLLAEELLSIERELYISILVDRSSQLIQVVAHNNGGVEVEDNSHFNLWSIENTNDVDHIGQALADYYDIPEKTFLLQDIVEQLYKCFIENDATLIEINPLILTSEGFLVAGDAKITLDQAAAFRHDWNFSQPETNNNFVTIDTHGMVATVANGAGLAMATVDAVYDFGMKPANFLDIGGGATAETLIIAFNQIAAYADVKAIVINIFAGITRSDEVARAIITARNSISHLPPLFIRIAGTNQVEAAAMLKEASFTLYKDLESCLIAAKEVVV